MKEDVPSWEKHGVSQDMVERWLVDYNTKGDGDKYGNALSTLTQVINEVWTDGVYNAPTMQELRHEIANVWMQELYKGNGD